MPIMTINIVIPTAKAARVRTAFGKNYGLVDGAGAPRDATDQEVSDYLLDHGRQIVRNVEAAVAVATVTDI